MKNLVQRESNYNRVIILRTIYKWMQGVGESDQLRLMSDNYFGKPDQRRVPV